MERGHDMFKIHWTWFLGHCLDYNSITVRVTFTTPIALIAYYFQLQWECTMWTDPFIPGSVRLDAAT
jgi:hypothetical protein